MKNKFTQFIMWIISILIIAAIVLIGIIIYQNFFAEVLIEPSVSKEEIYLDDFYIPEQNENNNETEIETETLKIEIAQKQEVKIYTNKFFYNQLNKYSKIIYEQFENNKEKMKTGTYQIEFGSKFSEVLSKENGQEILGDYYQSAIEAYMYDNPDVFYLNPTNMYLNIETTTRGSSKNYSVFVNNGEKENYLLESFKTKEQIDVALSKIENIRNKIIGNATGNTYQKIKKVHDYLVDNIEYEKKDENENAYNIYGALVENRCVCEGYAKAFKYLMDGIGIECNLVIGEATNSVGESENHAWNYVKIEDNYYAVDTTWDDPIVIGGTATPDMRYKYFLKGENDINSDHFPSGKFTDNGMEFQYPELNKEKYNV